jgi:hypothetical protein
VKQVAVAAVYLPASWLVGGEYGLAAGAALFLAWLLLRPPRGLIYGASVALLAAAPVVMIAQGLARGPVAGPGFATHHLAAHILVGLALAAAALGGLVDLLGGPWGRPAPFTGLRAVFPRSARGSPDGAPPPPPGKDDAN